MRITFASDMSFNYIETAPSAENARKIMKEPAEIMSKSDFRMVNLENIFGDKATGEPIIKSGPNLISDDGYMEYVKALNPTIVGLANNHAKDYGEAPMLYTKALLEKEGYIAIGAGKNLDEAYAPAEISKDGVNVSIIAVCENEFGIARRNESGTAGFMLGRVAHGIFDARKKGSKPVVYFHGGNERNPFPSPMKAELYRHFIDIGAEAVIAMHTHCPQGFEMYNGKPIVYSMGNFFFPATRLNDRKTWSYGYMSTLDIKNDSISLEIHPYSFDFDGIYMMKGEELARFEEYLALIAAPISDPDKLDELFDIWCMTQEHYINALEKYDASMLREGDKECIKGIKNVFGCEAHNELVTNMLKMIYDGRVAEAEKKTYIIEKLQAYETDDF